MFRKEIENIFRVFPVTAVDQRDGETEAIMLPLTKDELRAAQICGQSSKELIERICAKQGYKVVSIGKPDKMTVVLDAVKLCEWWEGKGADQRKDDYLYFLPQHVSFEVTADV